MNAVSLAVRLALVGAAASAHAAGVQAVPAEQVCAAARGLLLAAAARAGLAAVVECPHARAADVAEGTPGWSLAAKGTPLVAGPARVVMQPTVEGRAGRDVVVPVVLSLSSKAWVARRPMAAGELVTAADLELRDVAWPVGMLPAIAGEAAPAGRARLALKSGDVVGERHLVEPRQLLQGDPVKVALHRGALVLELPAVLSADARVGQVARVQLHGRRDTLEGVLVDPSTVVLEH